VPARGEKTGTAAAIVKMAVATVLFRYPVSTPIALSVSVEETTIGPVYRVDEVLGVAPLVV